MLHLHWSDIFMLMPGCFAPCKQQWVWRSSSCFIIFWFMRFGSTVFLPSAPPPSALCLHLPPTNMLEAHCFPKCTSSKEGFHNFIIYFSFPSPSLPKRWTNKPGCSLGYPRFLLPVTLQLLPIYVQRALKSQEEAVQAGSFVVVAGAINTLAPTGGLKSKHGFSSHTLSDQQWVLINEGNPWFCSVFDLIKFS